MANDIYPSNVQIDQILINCTLCETYSLKDHLSESAGIQYHGVPWDTILDRVACSKMNSNMSRELYTHSFDESLKHIEYHFIIDVVPVRNVGHYLTNKYGLSHLQNHGSQVEVTEAINVNFLP